MMFEKLAMAPPDPIMGLRETFKRDQNPAKINVSSGLYQDGEGKTPILRSVKRAEVRILQKEMSKSYLSIEGSADYATVVQSLLFGPEHEIVTSRRAVTAHTPGGTGALRLAGELINKVCPTAHIWVSQPTWPNHPNISRAAGLEVKTYTYFDSATNRLAFDRLLRQFNGIPKGDVVLLHGCCHNPTGIDPTRQQWAQIAEVLRERNLLPMVDLAYQGFGDGLGQDAASVLALCHPGHELLIASSFSKNFGLYKERVGALTLVASSRQVAQVALSHMKNCIRANYSNPPGHGAAIVTTVLSDAELCAEWEAEVDAMRDRINRMRYLLVETLAAKGVTRDFSFINRQRGMFFSSGLTREQANTLREKYSIYILDSGRINLAGLTEANMEVFCQAMAEVLLESSKLVADCTVQIVSDGTSS